MNKLFVSVFLWALIGQGNLLGVDLTLQDGAKGSRVVQAVIDVIRENCILQSDRLFLKRLALIQSNDGTDAKTYRTGYNGGIWQIDEQTFNRTRRCETYESRSVRTYSSYLRRYYSTLPTQPNITICEKIETKLNISWSDVEWTDLRKPLYSGLAAALHIISEQGDSVPGDARNQSRIWRRIFNPAGNVTEFVQKAASIQGHCSKPIDLAFIIDSSGSIGSTNFRTTLNFMNNITDGLTIGPDNTRVAVVKFYSTSVLEFGFNTYTNSSSLKQAISRIFYTRGGTNTAAGLRLAATRVFSASGGVNENSVKIALVITDGMSYNYRLTATAAAQLRAEGVLVFAVGIGGAWRQELEYIATDPDCTHVFDLYQYSEIDSVINEIQKSACRAQLSFEDRSPAYSTNRKVISKEIPFRVNETEVNIVIPVDSRTRNTTNTTTLVTEISCGMVYIYASYDSTHPSDALYSFSDVALAERPSAMTVRDETGRPLYVTYQGRKYNATVVNRITECEEPVIKSSVFKGEPEGDTVTCRENGEERNCTLADLQHSQYHGYFHSDVTNLVNPCYRDSCMKKFVNIYHDNRLDRTKYLKCDVNGNMFVMQCPDGGYYSHRNYSCGGNILLSDRPDLPEVQDNQTAHSDVEPFREILDVCDDLYETAAAARDAVRSNNDKGVEVVCRENGQEKNCTFVHFQMSHHKNLLKTETWKGIENPCLPGVDLELISNRLHSNDLDPAKFIICDERGKMHVGQCPRNLKFHRETFSCRM